VNSKVYPPASASTTPASSVLANQVPPEAWGALPDEKHNPAVGWCALVAGMVIYALFATGAFAGIATRTTTRSATPIELAAIKQALFDRYFANTAISRVQVISTRVLTLPHPGAVGGDLVSKYAVVDVKGWDRSGQYFGNEAVVAAYYSQPRSGWHPFADGTDARLGCVLAAYPNGQERAITAELGLRCQK
jgi:hypothetical protein